MKALLFAGIVLAAGCSEKAPGPPFRAEVLEHTAPGEYTVVEQELSTLTNLELLDGAAVKMYGGGNIQGLNLSMPNTEEEFRAAFGMKDANEPSLRYSVVGGAVRALDYDTFAMLSVYRGFERAQAFYRSLGVPEDALGRMPAYYKASINLVIFRILSSDNAAFVPTIDGFLMLPDSLAGNLVPLALNLGVIAHEYGHAVFNHLVWQKHIPPYAFMTDWPSKPQNHIAALEEGLADIFGATLTADPNFIGRSVTSLSPKRDLSLMRAATAKEIAALEGGEAFDPHQLGAVIASALWAASATTGREVMARAVVQAEQAIAGKVTRSFTVGVYFDSAVEALADPEHRRALCGALNERLGLLGPFGRCAGITQ